MAHGLVVCRTVCLIAPLSTRANSERRSTCSVEEDMFAVRQRDMLSRLVRSRLTELMQNRLVCFIVWLFPRRFDVLQREQVSLFDYLVISAHVRCFSGRTGSSI